MAKRTQQKTGRGMLIVTEDLGRGWKPMPMGEVQFREDHNYEHLEAARFFKGSRENKQAELLAVVLGYSSVAAARKAYREVSEGLHEGQGILPLEVGDESAHTEASLEGLIRMRVYLIRRKRNVAIFTLWMFLKECCDERWLGLVLQRQTDMMS